MLQVQQYLQNKTFADLTAELGIKVCQHDSLPLCILNYDQIESPKTNPIVRECRALVLRSDTHELVARSFPRFFNWGEVLDEQPLFDFSDFVVQSKEDGSLVVIYHFDGEWHANTRGSFALDKIEFQDFSWRDAFCKAMKINSLAELRLNEQVAYICEFVSPWNKIVRRYEQPEMYLLTAFQGEAELSPDVVDQMVNSFGGLFKRPQRYNFCSIDEIQDFLREQSASDATFEGVVIRDKHGHRWKIKSATYLGLHKLRGEGDNIWNPKHLLPFVMSGEEDELLTYFPEVRGAFYELKANVLELYSEMLEAWADNWRIEGQKDFALTIKDKPFSSVLFSVRKEHGTNQRAEHVRKAWLQAESQILKTIKA